jgi:hypothetical protein
VWNIDIEDVGGGNSFEPEATLYDLNLELYDETMDELVSSSSSKAHNTENIWIDGALTAGHRYELRVTGEGDFDWDYALAWRTIPEPATGGCW